MKTEPTVQLAITEVIAESIGSAVDVALSPQELTRRQRRHTQQSHRQSTKRPRLRLTPCQIDVSLKVEQFKRQPPERSEAWIYIDSAIEVRQEKVLESEALPPSVLRVVEQLLPVSVELGQPFRLRCLIEADPEPEVTWYRNGQELNQTEDDRAIQVAVLDDSELILSVDKSTTDDAGEYEVRITNSSGTEVSRAEVKVVSEAPRFLQPLEDDEVSVQIGDNVKLPCRVVGTPLPAISWIILDEKSGEEIKLSENSAALGKHFITVTDVELEGKDVRRKVVATSFEIRKVKVPDSRIRVFCTAENAVGKVSCSSRIKPWAVPRITLPLRTTAVRRGTPVNLRCVATGWPRPQVTWLFDGRPLDVSKRFTDDDSEEVESQLDIVEMSPITSGCYCVTAVNEYGDDICQAELTVSSEPPQFIERFHDKTVDEDSTLTLLAKVTGIPFPTVRWMRNEEVLVESARCRTLVDGDVCTLVVERLTTADSGRFTCVAENPVGLAKCAARISVTEKTEKPTIDKGPSDQTTVENGNCMFEAIIRGNPQPTVQWFKKDAILVPSDTVLYNNRDCVYTLTMKKVQPDSAGLISVRAFNLAGETTASANLIVTELLYPPLIVKHLVDRSVLEGEQAKFECHVKGKPNPTVSWSRNGTELVANDTTTVINSVQNGPDLIVCSLVLNNLSLADFGDIRAVASNSEGNDYTSAKLAIQVRTKKPEFVKRPEDQAVIEGDNCSFDVEVVGKPEPTVQWFINDDSLPYNATTSSDGCKHTLSVRKAQLQQAGHVTIKASNVDGESVASASLIVREKLVPPSFTRPLADQTVIEGDNSQFICRVRGKPVPEIDWFVSGASVEPGETVRLSLSPTDDKQEVEAILTMTSVAASEVPAVVAAVARNPVGEAESSASLTVFERTEKPRFVRRPVDQEITEDDECMFEVELSGKPQPSVSWYFENTLLKPSDHFRLEVDGSKYVVRVLDAKLHHTGSFTAKAVNSAGETSASAALLVNEKMYAPVFIESLSDKEVTETDSVHFTCAVQGKPLPRIKWFAGETELFSDADTEIQLEKLSQNQMSLSLRLTSVNVNDADEYRAVATNIAGSATTSSRLTVKMKLEEPTILRELPDQEIFEDGKCYFETVVSGKPAPAVQWLKDGDILVESERISLSSDRSKHVLAIDRARLSDAGCYSLRAHSEAGVVSSSGNLVVLEKFIPPVFSQKLVDQVVTEKDDVEFVCTARGKPIPEVAWLMNGNLLTSENNRFETSHRPFVELNEVNSTLKLRSVSVSDAAVITAIASNSAGKAETVARFDVNVRMEPPLMLTKPQDQEITEGYDAIFEVEVTGKPEPTVTWHFDDVMLRPSELLLFEKAGSRHVFSLCKALLHHAGNYTVKAVNLAGEVSASASLKVNEQLIPPVFIVNLTDVEVDERGSSEFNCTVTGKPLPDIKWYQDTTELTDNENVRLTCSKKGQNELSVKLEVTSTGFAEAGLYKVVATNVAGTASSSAQLTVNVKSECPVMLKQLDDQTVTEDDDVYFEVNASGTPAPQLQWLKDGIVIERSDRVRWSAERSKHTLTIRQASLSDAGQYTVKLTNVAGELSSSALLTVLEVQFPPVFKVKPADQHLLEEDKVVFKCVIEGKPVPTTKWIKAGQELDALNDSRIAIDRSVVDGKLHESLSIRDLAFDDSGELTVVANNSAGEARTAVRLVVDVKATEPVFTTEIEDQEIMEGDSCHFEVTVIGKPQPIVHWFRNDVKLEPCERYTMLSDETYHRLTVNRARLLESAQYSARAINVAGETTTSANLIVNEKRKPPVIIEELTDFDVVEGAQVSFICRVTGKPLPEVKWIQNNVEVKSCERVQVETNAENTSLLITRMTVSQLLIDDSGEVIVVASNSEGQAVSSAKLIVNVKTERPVFLKALQDVEINEGDDCSFETEVIGKPDPTVHWYKSDVKIERSSTTEITSDDARHHRLVIRKAAIDQAGSYTVRAINAAGEIYSSALLRVNESTSSPLFIDSLRDVETTEEETVSFECLVEGKPLPEVKWFIGDVDIRSVERARSVTARRDVGKLWASLTIDYVSLNEDGEIKAVARNLTGETSSTCRLHVKAKNSKPVIMKAPVSQEIIEDDECIFEAIIIGQPQPEVTWFKGDVKLDAGAGVTFGEVGTRYSLSIRNAKLVDAGLYNVTAVNVAGTSVAKATLTVIDRQIPPTFVKKLDHHEATEGECVRFECTAHGKPLPEITWYKDDKEIASVGDTKVNIIADKATSTVTATLSFDNVTPADIGELKVMARNSAGKAYTVARLSVNVRTEPPIVLTGPIDREHAEGEFCQFEAVITGKPEPVVQWFKGDIKISSSSKFQADCDVPRYTLTISGLKTGDAGLYCIRAYNVAGETEAAARLTVLDHEESPYFTRMLEDVSVSEGMPATFFCEVYPTHAPVTWLVEDVTVSSYDDPGRFRLTSDEETGERRLMFVRTSRKETCSKVTAVVGELESHAELIVESSDTEVVETRLLYEIDDDEDLRTRVAMEFLCLHGDGAAAAEARLGSPSTSGESPHTIEVRGLTEPGRLVAREPVRNASQRRWIVRKAYVDRGGEYPGQVIVERWSVRSYVDYTCSSEALVNVSLGILDDVKYTKQTVEFVVVLSAACQDSVWFKDGRKVAAVGPSCATGTDGRHFYRKYEASTAEGGVMHTLIVNDVHVRDEGVYTFRLLRDLRQPKQQPSMTSRYRIEGSMDASNLAVLMKGLAERQEMSGSTSAVAPDDNAVSCTNTDVRKSAPTKHEAKATAAKFRHLDHKSVLDKQTKSSSTSGKTSPSSSLLKCPDLDEVDSGPPKRNQAFFWSQFHEFQRRLVTAETHDQSAVASDTNNNKRISSVYYDEDDVFSSVGEDRKYPESSVPTAITSSSSMTSRAPTSWRSLMFSETTSLPYDDLYCGQTAAASSLSGAHIGRSTTSTTADNPLLRSRSLPSVFGDGPRRGRRKSEVLYFSYAESQMTGMDI